MFTFSRNYRSQSTEYTLFATGLRGAPKVDVNVTICGQPVQVVYAGAYPLIEGIDTIAFLPPMRDKEYLNTNWVQIAI